MTNKDFNKDTVIIAYYINVGNIDSCDIKPYVDEISDSFKLEGNVIQYFIPITNGNSYVDCIYPKFMVSKDEFSRVNDKMKILENNLNKIINKQENEQNN